MMVIAEFQPLIGPVIPEIIKMLKKSDKIYCYKGFEALWTLSAQSKMAKLFKLPRLQ